MSKLEMTGNIGCYIDDDSVISFQMGDNIQSSARSSDLLFNNPASVGPDLIWHSIKGFNVASRGRNNMKCEEITADIKNRSEERRVGKECLRMRRSLWLPYH